MKAFLACCAAAAALWGCGSSSSPLADIRAGRLRGILVELTDERKLVFQANEYRYVQLDSAYAIVGKCKQIEDRFGPTSIVMTDSIPSVHIADIEGYGPDTPEQPADK